MLLQKFLIFSLMAGVFGKWEPMTEENKPSDVTCLTFDGKTPTVTCDAEFDMKTDTSKFKFRVPTKCDGDVAIYFNNAVPPIAISNIESPVDVVVDKSGDATLTGRKEQKIEKIELKDSVARVKIKPDGDCKVELTGGFPVISVNDTGDAAAGAKNGKLLGIVLGTIGAVVVAGVVGFVLWWFCCRKKKDGEMEPKDSKEDKKTTHDTTKMKETDADTSKGSSKKSRKKPKDKAKDKAKEKKVEDVSGSKKDKESKKDSVKEKDAPRGGSKQKPPTTKKAADTPADGPAETAKTKEAAAEQEKEEIERKLAKDKFHEMKDKLKARAKSIFVVKKRTDVLKTQATQTASLDLVTGVPAADNRRRANARIPGIRAPAGAAFKAPREKTAVETDPVTPAAARPRTPAASRSRTAATQASSSPPAVPESAPGTPASAPGTPVATARTPGSAPGTAASTPRTPGSTPGTPVATARTPGSAPGTPEFEPDLIPYPVVHSEAPQTGIEPLVLSFHNTRLNQMLQNGNFVMTARYKPKLDQEQAWAQMFNPIRQLTRQDVYIMSYAKCYFLRSRLAGKEFKYLCNGVNGESDSTAAGKLLRDRVAQRNREKFQKYGPPVLDDHAVNDLINKDSIHNYFYNIGVFTKKDKLDCEYMDIDFQGSCTPLEYDFMRSPMSTIRKKFDELRLEGLKSFMKVRHLLDKSAEEKCEHFKDVNLCYFDRLVFFYYQYKALFDGFMFFPSHFSRLPLQGLLILALRDNMLTSETNLLLKWYHLTVFAIMRKTDFAPYDMNNVKLKCDVLLHWAPYPLIPMLHSWYSWDFSKLPRDEAVELMDLLEDKSTGVANDWDCMEPLENA